MNAMIVQGREGAVRSDGQQPAVGRDGRRKQVAMRRVGDRWAEHALGLARLEVPEANRLVEPDRNELPRIFGDDQFINGFGMTAGVEREKRLVVVRLVVDLR